MRHLLRRIAFYLAALWASVTINFILPRLMPGDPVQAYVNRLRGQGTITQATLDAIRLQLGVSNDPLWIQYFHYLGNLLRGELGIATSHFPTPVVQVIATDLPWTIGLVGVASIISFLLGTLLGVVVSWKRNSWVDTVVTPLLTFFSAIPYFWLALGLLYIFSFNMGIFPLGGGYDALSDIYPGWNLDFILSVLLHAILPALTVVISSISGWVLGMRNAMVTTLSEDYVLLARAKGLPERRVMFTYAARNAILPNITGLGMSLGFVVGGALLTEMVFSYPGIGFDLLTAIRGFDYSLIQGIFLMIAIAMLTANFLSDIVYALLDPRVRHERG
ncbi:peptide/nickel transport system permease protein [Thermosporothrix hazakensis]|jgi:peptide/nickel transport system permease protein|uniref:Peptide/nickel transport system permease protein n=2 Tax=Thermosporothrix TaxID=768650 RepID=A0A326UCL9_THEHA|nr:ABC transporter permease [Thermosporothrix hazakensis]PZW34349.1 peptide/nickel transport system permease protein [Thermosporothrix hazakensis]BBH85471.1 peptide ABC transporter permease [Thermosporothrix sp. COM3]GCE46102.1 peptide ABC transporter permease [Thermosporothrix hazakensis]